MSRKRWDACCRLLVPDERRVFLTWATLLVTMLFIRNYFSTPISTVMFWGLLVLFVAASFFAAVRLRGQIDFGDPYVFTCMAGWYVWGLVSAALSPDRATSFGDMARYGLMFACFGAYLQWFGRLESLIKALRCLRVILIVYSLLLVPKLAFAGGGISRALGIHWHSPAESGSYYAAFVPLYLGLVAHMRAGRMRVWSGLALFLAACVMTRSASALAGMAAGVFALLVVGMEKRQRLTVLWGVLTVSAIFFCAVIFVKDFGGWLLYQLSGRERIWAAALEAVRDHPLFGIGPGRWPAWFGSHYYASDFLLDDLRGNIFFLSPATLGGQAHNLFLTKAAEMGLPSLVFTIGIFVSWGLAATRILGSLGAGFERDLVKSSIASFLGMSLFSLFENGPVIGVAREGEVVLVMFILAIPFGVRAHVLHRYGAGS